MTTDYSFLQAGAAAQRARYADLSHTYAAAGEGRLAALAVWAADLHTVQMLLWESGLGSAPDPDAHLAAVATAVLGSLADQVADDSRASVRESVARARQALVATFDESVHAKLAERFEPLDFLDPLAPPDFGDIRRILDRRLAGRTPRELITHLRVAAGDCMAVAAAMVHGADLIGAKYQARQADLASFEAYLVEAALGFGDASLATVELRWDLAMLADEQPQADEGLMSAVSDLRGRLLETVGPAEQPQLRSCFEDLARLPA